MKLTSFLTDVVQIYKNGFSTTVDFNPPLPKHGKLVFGNFKECQICFCKSYSGERSLTNLAN